MTFGSSGILIDMATSPEKGEERPAPVEFQRCGGETGENGRELALVVRDDRKDVLLMQPAPQNDREVPNDQ